MTAPTRDLSLDTTPSTPRAATAPATVSSAPDPVLYTYKRAPMEIVRGEGVYLVDDSGRRYLDFVSGIAVNALGYGDEGLVAALHAGHALQSEHA